MTAKATYSTPMLHVAEIEKSIPFYELLGFATIDTEGCNPMGCANALRERFDHVLAGGKASRSFQARVPVLPVHSEFSRPARTPSSQTALKYLRLIIRSTCLAGRSTSPTPMATTSRLHNGGKRSRTTGRRDWPQRSRRMDSCNADEKISFHNRRDYSPGLLLGYFGSESGNSGPARRCEDRCNYLPSPEPRNVSEIRRRDRLHAAPGRARRLVSAHRG